MLIDLGCQRLGEGWPARVFARQGRRHFIIKKIKNTGRDTFAVRWGWAHNARGLSSCDPACPLAGSCSDDNNNPKGKSDATLLDAPFGFCVHAQPGPAFSARTLRLGHCACCDARLRLRWRLSPDLALVELCESLAIQPCETP